MLHMMLHRDTAEVTLPRTIAAGISKTGLYIKGRRNLHSQCRLPESIWAALFRNLSP